MGEFARGCAGRVFPYRELSPCDENWNAALALSSGEYVVMMGDDDGLLPGYISRMRELIGDFRSTRHNLLRRAPVHVPWGRPSPTGGRARGMDICRVPRHGLRALLVARQEALAAVRRVMDFRLAYHFNMQLSLLNRNLIERVQHHGEFFQSPFPDYYATTAAFLEAQRIVADPRPNSSSA